MKNVGLIKRLIVICYDGLLLVGVVLGAYAVLFLLLLLLPEELFSGTMGKVIKGSYLIISVTFFYGWFWTHGGQTLGMKVWNLYLVNNQGKFISWKISIVRLFSAVFSWCSIAALLYICDVDRWYFGIGVGFIWSLVDKTNLTWHDHISKTRIVQMPKESKPT